ncbi:MAG: helix-turn-helix transcriptional regulator [Coriobacteriia bacterium]|nr:helix-turn-helix transcriptional regulator [Coriobacteriia bacterium]
MGGIDRYFEQSYQNPMLIVVYLVVSVAFVLLLPWMGNNRIRKAINTINIGLVIIWSAALLFVHAGGSFTYLSNTAIVIVGLIIHAMLLFQWNVHFTLNKVIEVGLILWVASFASIILLFLFYNSSFLLPLPAVCALPLISSVSCWWIEIKDTANPVSENSLSAISEYDQLNFSTVGNPRTIRMLFFGFRLGLSILYGIASGTFSSFYAQPQTNMILALLIFTAAIAMSVALLVAYRSKISPIRFNIVLPFLIAFSMITVYLGSKPQVLSRVAIGIAWTVGHVFSLSQLPTYREMTKMDLLRFSYLEKASLLVPYAVSALLTSSIVITNNVYQQYSEQVDLAVVYFMLMMVVVYGIALTRHLLLYFPKQHRLELTEAVEDEIDKVNTVANRYSLTKRESEVLFYLAKGYSRPYIEKKLFISKGTAKTHIFKIFQKIGVSSQDELIELVEQG